MFFLRTLLMFVFVFSIPSISFALPKCGNTFHECTGEYTYKSGNKYVGDWKNNKRHGFGTFYQTDGGYYVGDYLNDKRHGKGKLVQANGHSYKGDFVDNKVEGVGTVTLPDKRVIVGFFRDGKLLYSRNEWQSIKRNFCRKFSNITQKKINIKKWESSEQKYKEFINKIPKDDLTKLGLINDYNDLIYCFNKSKSSISSAISEKLSKKLKAKAKEIANKVEEENQHTIVDIDGNIKTLKIPNLEEYNSTKSVGLSKAHPAIKFIVEKNRSIDFWQEIVGHFRKSEVSIEEASTCTLKIRDNLSGETKRRHGKVRKVYLDFNKVNWKTWDSRVEEYRNVITLQCTENCFFKYGTDFFRRLNTVTWRPKKYILLYVKRSQKMHYRLNDALRDLREVCNKSTSKY